MRTKIIEKTKTTHLLPIAVLVCVSAFVYFNSLSNGFVYDDLGTIVENVHIKRFSNFLSSFYNQSYFKISGGEASYRPLATLSYYLLYAVFDVNPFGYRLFSFALHIFNVILVYMLARIIIANKRAALMAGLLFACHPVNAEAVNGISYNEDLLAAFFFFVALLFYMRLQPSASKPGYLFFALSLSFFLLGLLSKEMAITLPAIVVLYDLILREPVCEKVSVKRVLAVIQDRKYYYAGYLGVGLFYLWLRFFAIYNPQEVETQIWGRLIDRVLYLPVIFLKYIQLSLFPYPLNADYVFTYPTRFVDGLPLLSFLVVLGLVIYSFFALRNQKALSFGIWWFFITLFPVCNLIQIYNPFAERYMYIPLLGFCLVISIFLETLLSRISFNRAGILRVFIIGCVVGAFSLITINRNRDWKDSYSLWTQTLEVEPDSFRAHGNLARVYQERGMIDASLREVKKTLELNPNDYKAYYNLGVVLGEQGFVAEAVSAYQKTVAKNPRFKSAHFNLGTIYKSQNRLEAAKRAFKKVVELDPDDIEARNNLGVIYAMQGKLDAALVEWQQVIALDPANRDVQDNIEKAKKLIDQSQ
ncbi:MAG: tetratricopeptide repeat protein [Deltaproteobacteria bacterium]|jgi:tetratricopeptide (TPR) repeat protein|nr:tetratricopeptide repeat protein [Deltaproteobacteria bacterium]